MRPKFTGRPLSRQMKFNVGALSGNISASSIIKLLFFATVNSSV